MIGTQLRLCKNYVKEVYLQAGLHTWKYIFITKRHVQLSVKIVCWVCVYVYAYVYVHVYIKINSKVPSRGLY